MSESEIAAPPSSRSDDDVRHRLIEAGLDVFGEEGFAAATTRTIAQRAGANLAAIPYYFRGKEGLYHAVIEHIVCSVTTPFTARVETARVALEKGEITPSAAIDTIAGIIGMMIGFCVASPNARRYARIMLREQMQPSPAFDIVFERMMKPMVFTMTELVLTVANRRISDREATLRVHALMGQALHFRSGRETVVRYLGMEGYTPAEEEEIRQVVLAQTRVVLEELRARNA